MVKMHNLILDEFAVDCCWVPAYRHVLCFFALLFLLLPLLIVMHRYRHHSKNRGQAAICIMLLPFIVSVKHLLPRFFFGWNTTAGRPLVTVSLQCLPPGQALTWTDAETVAGWNMNLNMRPQSIVAEWKLATAPNLEDDWHVCVHLAAESALRLCYITT